MFRRVISSTILYFSHQNLYHTSESIFTLSIIHKINVHVIILYQKMYKQLSVSKRFSTVIKCINLYKIDHKASLFFSNKARLIMKEKG